MAIRRALSYCAALTITLAAAGCDQLPGSNKYDLVADKNGRTVRLDKRTGEITIIDGDKLITPKSAEEAERAKKTERTMLADAKNYPSKTIKHMTLTASLSTSWQDGKVYYVVGLLPMASDPKGDARKSNLAAFKNSMARHAFNLILEDVPFELLNTRLTTTYLADDKGDVMGYEARGNAPMSQETYSRLDTWNISWQRKF